MFDKKAKDLELKLGKALGDEEGGITERSYFEQDYTCENFVGEALGDLKYLKEAHRTEVDKLKDALNRAHRELMKR